MDPLRGFEPRTPSLPNSAPAGATRGRQVSCFFAMEPSGRIELPTHALQVRCSTAELRRLMKEKRADGIVYEKEGGSPLYSLLLLYAGIQFPEKLIQSNQYQTYNPCVKFIVFHADSI